MGQGVRRSGFITSILLARSHILSIASVQFPYRATSRLFVTVRTHATLLSFCFNERAENLRRLNASLLSTRKGWVSRSRPYDSTHCILPEHVPKVDRPDCYRATTSRSADD